jgi:hypothetical protein
MLIVLLVFSFLMLALTEAQVLAAVILRLCRTPPAPHGMTRLSKQTFRAENSSQQQPDDRQGNASASASVALRTVTIS